MNFITGPITQHLYSMFSCWLRLSIWKIDTICSFQGLFIISVLHQKLEVVGSETEFLPGYRVDSRILVFIVNSVIIYVLDQVIFMVF